MAKRDLSAHQEKIVKRYYEHHETIQADKLSDIVSELWLAEDEKAKTKLWGKAQVALMRLGVDATVVAQVVAQRDAQGLAKLVARVDAGGSASARTGVPGPRGTGAAKGTWKGQGPEPRRAGSVSVSDGRTIAQAKAERAAAGGYDGLDEANLKRALRAFRSKLKNLRREDESRLGGRYTSAGRKSGITAITPPDEYPGPVWDKLVELRRLNRAGQGLYELPEDTAGKPKH